MKSSDSITFYCTTWCGDCIRSKAILDKYNINYEEINIDNDQGASEKVQELNNGNRSVPTIVFQDNSSLTEPSTEELTQKLASLSLIKG